MLLVGPCRYNGPDSLGGDVPCAITRILILEAIQAERSMLANRPLNSVIGTICFACMAADHDLIFNWHRAHCNNERVRRTLPCQKAALKHPALSKAVRRCSEIRGKSCTRNGTTLKPRGSFMLLALGHIWSWAAFVGPCPIHIRGAPWIMVNVQRRP